MKSSFTKNLLPALFLFVAGMLLQPWRLSAMADLPGATDNPKISVSSDLVLLQVNVTDASGDNIPSLIKSNFRIFEGNQPREIAFFAHEGAPIRIGIVVDHSGSMKARLSDALSAANVLARSTRSEDELFVVKFNDSSSIQNRLQEPLINDPREIANEITSDSAHGQTALYDALADGMNYLQSAPSGKKALVVVSDGVDNASLNKYPDVLKMARRTQVAIYAIGLSGASHRQGFKRLRGLCRETGGNCEFPKTSEDAVAAATKLSKDLREGYLVGFVPTGQAINGNRKVLVEVNAAGHRTVRVRMHSTPVTQDRQER